MAQAVSSVSDIYRLYIGNSAYMLLALVALLYLFITEENKNVRTILVYIVSTFLVLFFIPGFAYVIINYILEYEIYYRMLWFVPMALLVAYAGVKVLLHAQKRSRKIVTGILFLAIMMFGGQCVFTDGTYTKADNAYHVPNIAVEIVDLITTEEYSPVTALPAELVQYVRQVDSSIKLCYGREILVDRWNNANPLFDAIQAAELDVWTIQSEARRQECTCIVIDNEKPITGNFYDELYGYYTTVGHYDIYIDFSILETYYGVEIDEKSDNGGNI